ncbi:hypothetical protein AAMO2058_000944300 [Amorphochlora amoebiformis]
MSMNRRKVHQSAGRHGEKFWDEERNNFGFKMMQRMGWSQGEGLGKNRKGTTSFIRVSQKRDNSGIGAKGKQDDNWSAITGVFNHLLKRLASSNPEKDEKEQKFGLEKNEGKGMEYKTSGARLKSFVTRRTLYGRFKAAKDTSKHTKQDRAAIFGKSNIFGNISASTKSSSPEFKSDVFTTVASTNIRDYFANKVKSSNNKSRFNAAGGSGFTEDQQSSYYMAMHNLNMSRSSRGGLGFGVPEQPSSSSSQSNSALSSPPPPPALPSSTLNAEGLPAKKKKKKKKAGTKKEKRKKGEKRKNGDKESSTGKRRKGEEAKKKKKKRVKEQKVDKEGKVPEPKISESRSSGPNVSEPKISEPKISEPKVSGPKSKKSKKKKIKDPDLQPTSNSKPKKKKKKKKSKVRPAKSEDSESSGNMIVESKEKGKIKKKKRKSREDKVTSPSKRIRRPGQTILRAKKSKSDKDRKDKVKTPKKDKKLKKKTAKKEKENKE